ncbi:MAG: hypothetical protein AAB917_03185 [Patescibacteria group bacterium]
MTILKARKILGTLVLAMSDKEIQEIIDCLSSIIEVGFQTFEEKKMKTSNHIFYKS